MDLLRAYSTIPTHTTRDCPYIHREVDAPPELSNPHVGSTASIIRYATMPIFMPSSEVYLGINGLAANYYSQHSPSLPAPSLLFHRPPHRSLAVLGLEGTPSSALRSRGKLYIVHNPPSAIHCSFWGYHITVSMVYGWSDVCQVLFPLQYYPQSFHLLPLNTTSSIIFTPSVWNYCAGITPILLYARSCFSSTSLEVVFE